MERWRLDACYRCSDVEAWGSGVLEDRCRCSDVEGMEIELYKRAVRVSTWRSGGMKVWKLDIGVATGDMKIWNVGGALQACRRGSIEV